jgi:hypothetical protein
VEDEEEYSQDKFEDVGDLLKSRKDEESKVS